MWRILLVVTLLACGKSKEKQAREQLCRSDRDSAATYLELAVRALDRASGTPDADAPLPPRTPAKDPDLAFMEQAVDDSSELARRNLVIEKTYSDAREKLRGSAKQTLQHAIDQLRQQDGDHVLEQRPVLLGLGGAELVELRVHGLR
ncbi:MAG: hypothetical protein ACM31C_32415 [Acidobacteriota bacterium]